MVIPGRTARWPISPAEPARCIRDPGAWERTYQTGRGIQGLHAVFRERLPEPRIPPFADPDWEE